MLKIRSTEKLATSNTQGFCDIERTIIKNGENRDSNGVITSLWFNIESRHFQEKIVEEETLVYNETLGENVAEMVSVTQRKYIEENNHSKRWTYPIDQIEMFKQVYAQEMQGMDEEDKKLFLFISLTISAGENNTGWHGMTNWIVDNQPYKVVKKFSE